VRAPNADMQVAVSAVCALRTAVCVAVCFAVCCVCCAQRTTPPRPAPPHTGSIGSLFYAIYFFVSFPMFMRIDEHPGRRWTLSEVRMRV